MFFKKTDKKEENNFIVKVCALLIHAAKIDEDYSGSAKDLHLHYIEKRRSEEDDIEYEPGDDPKESEADIAHDQGLDILKNDDVPSCLLRDVPVSRVKHLTFVAAAIKTNICVHGRPRLCFVLLGYPSF